MPALLTTFEQSVLVLKPDLIATDKETAVLDRLVEQEFCIVQSRSVLLTREYVNSLIGAQQNEDSYEEIVNDMTSGPSTILLLERENGIQSLVDLVGPVDIDAAKQAWQQEQRYSLRAEFGTDSVRNAFYFSENKFSAMRDIKLFFGSEGYPVERTLAIIKPDAFERYAGAIVDEIENSGFLIVARKVTTLSEDEVMEFYAEHRGKPFYEKLVLFMTSGTLQIMVLEKPNAIAEWRLLAGPTNSLEAKQKAPTTLRARYGFDGQKNAVHGSDSVASAQREINFFFPGAQPVTRTLALIKPDAVAAGSVEAMLSIIREKGFVILEQQQVKLSKTRAEEFYAEHKGKAFFDGLTKFMSSGPLVALALARANAIFTWRELMGPTNSLVAKKTKPQSLRALFGTDGQRNACHGSDSSASAWRELRFFFPHLLAEPVPDGDSCRDFLLRRPLTNRDSSAAAFVAGQGYKPETTLQQLLIQALTEICREKPQRLAALRWLGNWLLTHNPNKPKVEEPEAAEGPASASNASSAARSVHRQAGAVIVQEPDEQSFKTPYPRSGNSNYPAVAVETRVSKTQTKPAATVKPTVVFVLGGPGSGKGTQCAKIVQEFGWVHLSAGDLLRAEVASGSKTGILIDRLIKEGQIVPQQITIELLRTAIKQNAHINKFLVDGFPRQIDQGIQFESEIVACSFVLFFDAPDDVLKARLSERGQSSGRSDDNAEAIKKRLVVYKEQTMPVIDAYSKVGKVRKISAVADVESVYAQVRKLFLPKVWFVLGGPGSGKGTQCNQIAEQFGYVHLSTGDLIREAVARGMPEGREVEELMRKGQLVPQYMVLNLLNKAMRERQDNKTKFLLDGFPRDLAQGFEFERRVCEPAGVLYFNCPRAVMQERLLSRGKTSGRSDDNLATIKKRFDTFVKQSVPVIEHYRKLGKVREISAVHPSSVVFENVRRAVEPEVVLLTGPSKSGCSTQAALMESLGYVHISVPHLINSELTKRTETGVKFESAIRDLKPIPSQALISLLKQVLNDHPASKFVLSGFPRSLEQIVMFEEQVASTRHAFHLDASSESLNGRTSTVPTSLHLAPGGFVSQVMPAIHHLARQGKVTTLPGDRPVNEVFATIKATLQPYVAFVLGGPGSGKGTQCAKLVQEFGFTHVSTGDILRAVVSSGDPAAEQIKSIQASGGLVPTSMVLSLLKKTMTALGSHKFLVDGFPRELEQARLFESEIAPPSLVLSFDADDEILKERLLARAEASGREDDNEETITARLETFHEQSEPVINYYKKNGKLVALNAARSVDEIYADARKHFLPKLAVLLGAPSSGVKTISAQLCRKFRMQQIDVEKLYATEIATGSERGQIIERCLKGARAVPLDISLALIKQATVNAKTQKFVLLNYPVHNGETFPYVSDQAFEIEEQVGPIQAVIFLDAPLTISNRRLIARGLDEGAVQARLDQFNTRIQPVADFYQTNPSDLYVPVDASGDVEGAWTDVSVALNSVL